MVQMTVRQQNRFEISRAESVTLELPTNLALFADQTGVDQHGIAAFGDKQVADAHHAADGVQSGRSVSKPGRHGAMDTKGRAWENQQFP